MRSPLVIAACLALALPASGAGAASQPVTIALSSFRFTPKAVTLRHGEPYVLHLVNTSGGGHDLVAPEFFAAARIAPEDRARVTKGEIELRGGETADIHLIAPAAGTYAMHCSHFMHATLGMTGSFVVD